MNNKIKSIDSSQTPKPAAAYAGPATAGIEYDKNAQNGAVHLVPDTDVTRFLVPTFYVSGAPTNGTSGTKAGVAVPGNYLWDFTNKKAYVNIGTKASPTWVATDGQAVSVLGTALAGTPSALVSRQFSAAGVGNGADATNDVLFTFAFPANSLSVNGQSIVIEAWGQTTNSATNKVASLYFGADAQTPGSAIVTTATAAIIASGNIGNGTAVGWYLWAQIKRTSAGNQIIGSLGQTGTTAITFAVPAATARADSGPLSVTVTGSDSGSVASRCLCNSFDVTFNN